MFDIECQFCGFKGTFEQGAEHRKQTQHLLRTGTIAELRRSERPEFCTECSGYIHMPWCPAYEPAVDDRELYKQPPPTSEHEPAAQGEGDEQWTCFRDGDGYYYIVRHGDIPVVIARTSNNYDAEQITSEHNQHQALVAERDAGLRAIAYLICDGIVNCDKYYPPEIATWARDLMVGEQRVGIQLIREAITTALNKQRSTPQ